MACTAGASLQRQHCQKQIQSFWERNRALTAENTRQVLPSAGRRGSCTLRHSCDQSAFQSSNGCHYAEFRLRLLCNFGTYLTLLAEPSRCCWIKLSFGIGSLHSYVPVTFAIEGPPADGGYQAVRKGCVSANFNTSFCVMKRGFPAAAEAERILYCSTTI